VSPATCPLCGSGPLAYSGYDCWQCPNEACDHLYIVCPYCGDDLPKLVDVEFGRARSHVRGACLGVALPPEVEG
jgi:hypothetical protein